jgi:hypothetical protein
VSSAALAVAGHELRDRWPALALTMALWTALVAFARSLPEETRPESPALALALVLTFAITIAVVGVLGASTLARDVGERRMASHPTTPIDALSLWSGKLLALLALMAIVLGCSTLGMAAYERLPGRQLVHDLATAATLLCWLVVAVTHFAWSALRSRSRWVVVDLAAAAALAAAALAVIRWFDQAGMARPLESCVIPGAQVGIGLAVLAGMYAQVVVGRSDAARAHRALSLTVWPLVATLLGATCALGAWLGSLGPDRLGAHEVRVAPAAGGAIATSDWRTGPFGHGPVFLLDVDSGSWVAWSPFRFTAPAFSAGGHAAWIADPSETWDWSVVAHDPGRVIPGLLQARRGPELVLARFDGPVPHVETRPLARAAWRRVVALDAGGTRAVAERDPDLVVLDTASGRELGVLRVNAIHVAFRADGALRLWTREGHLDQGDVVVLDWDVARATHEEIARFPPGPDVRGFQVLDPLGDVALRHDGFRHSAVVDLATGSTLELPEKAAAVRLLTDGTIAFSVGTELQVMDRTGLRLRSYQVPAGTRMISEPFPGQLALAIEDHPGWWRTVVLATGDGAVRSEHAGLRPAGYLSPPPPPGSPAARLVQKDGGDGGLFRLEPDGSLRELVPARRRSPGEPREVVMY